MINVLFVYSGNSKTGKNHIVERQAESLINSDINISLFPILGKGLWGYFKNVLKLRKHLKLHHFDIIHSHYGMSAIVSQISRRQEKHIVSFMGDDLVGSNRKNGEILRISKIIIIINRFMAKHFYDENIVKSEEMAGNLLHGTRYETIGNGVDLKTFFFIDRNQARANLNITEDQKIVLFVSDPARPEKNYALARQSIDNLQEVNINLLVPQNYDSKLINLYYNSADLVLLTSFHEGSPNVVKESMACNCPVVSTDVGDVKWTIGNTDGCFITGFDSNQVSSKVLDAIKFRQSKIQTTGRRRILELGLDSETVSSRIIKIYNKLKLASGE